MDEFIKKVVSVCLALVVVLLFYKMNKENRNIILNDKFNKRNNDKIKINDKCFKYHNSF